MKSENLIKFMSIWLTTICLSANAGFIIRSMNVNGTDARKCNAFIHLKTEGKKLPFILDLGGTGIFTTSREVPNPAVEYLVDSKMANALTIDKPGISTTSDGQLIVHDNEYNSYIQTDLVECVYNAMTWVAADNEDIFDGRIILNGHSEGAQVVLRVLNKEQGSSVNIIHAFVSGLPMQGWKTIIDNQLKGDPKHEIFWNAFEKKDNVTLRSIGNLAYDYLEDIFKTEPLEDLMKRLAIRGVKVPISIFHGLEDQNTPVRPVMEFEMWNLSRLREKENALRLSARFYNSGHGLNMSALNDYIFAFQSYLQP